MKKSIFTFLMVTIALTNIYSQSARKIGETQARQTAQTFIDANAQFQQAELHLVSESNVYVYNIGSQGFVIISGNTVLPPVLGYSDQGNFPDMTEAPENVSSWFNHYGEMIDFATANGIAPEPGILRQWDEMERGLFAPKGSRTVDPLVSTRWNQDCYYNEYCPATGGGWWGGGPCGHVYAGCVATAMGQVMKYWEHPATGFGSHSYTHSQYGVQSANFAATTYHWDQMPDQIYSHNDAVATLLYHCGVSVDMNYSATGSGAQSADVETALRSYFGYCGAKYRQKSNYDDEEWIAMLKAELDLAHPIYYSGSSGSSGHAFVCDGYDSNDFFHFNFGWSGSSDAFYSTYDVNGFNGSQAVVMNIYPIDIQSDENGIIYVTPDGNGNGSSWANATNKLEFATALSSGGKTMVWVKSGVYYGDSSDPVSAFYITPGNRIYGGFSGNETHNFDLTQRDFANNATILDGQGIKRVLTQEKSFNAGSEAVWDGFIIRNGMAGSGAGVYLNDYSGLENCTITNNKATMFGGGVYLNPGLGTPHATIKNCVISDNSASMGGGVCDRNGATYLNTQICNNTASTKGGGIYLYNNATPTFKSCVINNNTAKEAGAMYARGQFTAYNTNFVMNLATESVGGVFNEKRFNKYSNCILWGNMSNGLPSQMEGASEYEYCAVQGGVDGTAVITLAAENNGFEPGGFVRFNQTAQGAGADYHNPNWTLHPRSICLNAGKPNSTGLGNTDLYGNQRIQKGRVEIGAYESCASLTLINDVLYESDCPYWFHNRPLTEPGYYTAMLNGHECDSVIGLTLDILLDVSENAKNETKVWPNPTHGTLHIEAGDIQAVEVRNLLGQLVMQAKETKTLSLDGLGKGVYFLIINNIEGLRSVVKVVKD